MLEVSLAAMAACLPSLSFFAKDGRLVKAMNRLLSFSNFSSPISRWRGSGKKAESDSDLKPEIGLDSYQMPAETWTCGNIGDTVAGSEHAQTTMRQNPESTGYPSYSGPNGQRDDLQKALLKSVPTRIYTSQQNDSAV